MNKIILDFGFFRCEGELYESPAGETLFANLPRTISLEQWGNELYGPVGIELNRDPGSSPKLFPEITPGGIAYSRKGNYLCIFFGQKPAWEVEEIGRIKEGDWQKLLDGKSISKVVIRPRE